MSNPNGNLPPGAEHLDRDTPVPGSTEAGALEPRLDDQTPDSKLSKTGPLAWMASNSVAANLLMMVFVLGGLLLLPKIKQEVFPEFDLDMVSIAVAYPGASPAEVEQGVILAVEEAVRGVDGVKEVRSAASEGAGSVVAEINLGADPDRVLADIKSAVDRITSFPQDVERPVVSLPAVRRDVISIVVYGDQSEKALRQISERVRDDLLKDEGITVVELEGARPLEVSIEVPQEELRRYGLTLEAIAAKIREASVELPGGGVKTDSGEVLVRMAQRRDRDIEFGSIVVLSRPDGTVVRLGEIAQIKDQFRDTDEESYFDGKRAVMVEVYRVGDQTPIGIAATVKKYVAEHASAMPPGVGLAVWRDMSEVYADRLELLLTNAAYGLVLVLLTLGMFLELRLAFWVTLGIPISFTGSLLFLPVCNTSINMISLFAFIVTLGLVVDDAIVVGEAVFKRRGEGVSRLRAAVDGVREVAMPVVFAVLTTIAAFAPLLIITGVMGKFFFAIPVVVIAVLSISLIESLFILPAHLAHSKPDPDRGLMGFIHHQQQRFSRYVEWLILYTYLPTVARAVRRRYLAFAVGISILLTTAGLVAGGKVRFIFFPKVEGDIVSGSVVMPFGTPAANTRAIVQRMVEAAREVIAEKGGDEKVRGIFSQVGSNGVPTWRGGVVGGHAGAVRVFFVPVDQRDFTGAEFSQEWRKRMGEVPGAESLAFKFNLGPSAGDPINIELAHKDLEVLEAASAKLAASLKYDGVFDVDDGFTPGKEQLDFKLRPAASSLGITERDLARQVRAAFFGAEAARQQRGRDELRVYVRLPEAQRHSEHDIETLMVRTPSGGEIPLGQAAEVHRGRAYTAIRRTDGRRVVNVTADVHESRANPNDIIRDLEANVLPGLLAEYPGLSYTLAGEQKEQAESMQSLGEGFLMAVVAIFALLAVAFRSYVQPVIIMTVIPFGVVGAVLGHLMMGYDLSLMSGMGIVAASGVVVNDSLILIVAINRFRADGLSVEEAIVAGGGRRFRPILLTSLTTFFGLTPIITETSVQARFLIPMALSLGFGVLFATFITLLLVPALYCIVEDAGSFLAAAWRAIFGHHDPNRPGPPGPTKEATAPVGK